MVIQEVVNQCLKAHCQDCVLVAVSNPWDHQVLRKCIPENMGPLLSCDENDVLRRYLLTAELVDADPIIRITGDCPMINPEVIDLVEDAYHTHEADYASNVFPKRSFPKGWDVEIFSRELLIQAESNATQEYEREHVTPWMQAHATRSVNVEGDNDQSATQLSLDTIDDYHNIWRRMN